MVPYSPGWTHTGMTGAGKNEKPAGAWTAQETVLYMVRLHPLLYLTPFSPRMLNDVISPTPIA